MDDEQLKMTSKAAIEYVARDFAVHSLYAMAKSLSDDELTVQPIQISNYLKGRLMSEKVATRFEAVYGVYIIDAIRPGIFRSKPLPSKPKDA